MIHQWAAVCAIAGVHGEVIVREVEVKVEPCDAIVSYRGANK